MALNIPAIFIPLAIATKNEQLKNAKFVEKINGGIIIEEKKLSPELLLKKINEILFTDKIKRMKENLKKQKLQDGAKNMINLIFNLLEEKNDYKK
jgi:UDP-N-acetylglucosamine:LPS N-acetylglucosamine transferase